MEKVVDKKRDLASLILFILIMVLFLFGEVLVKGVNVPSFTLQVGTIFLSILLEAIPFILLGVFASSLIQTFVSEQMIQKWIPNRPLVALVPAAVVGALLPICECAIIPVVRRLISKGMPLHVGVVIMVTAPILNPVVFASTYYAFSSNMSIVYGRMVIAFVAALIIGLIVYVIFRNHVPLKSIKYSHHHVNSRLTATLTHAVDEFFDVGRYLIIGAFVASFFQVIINREILVEVGQHEIIGPILMMGLAYVLSLCSEADAFVAASFTSTFTPAALLAFLIYGPMIDFKNTLMMLAYFRRIFVVIFIGVVTTVVYVCIYIFHFIG
ncbi:permease [Anoxybacillus sp. LAT_35]|uniref:permease n=1 Tax=Anoxybacillus TaxID=150247 RepID=UPI001EDA9DF5|nr:MULTISPECIES: permease [Anoxybacillus]MCG5025076.1 permease [Anoxybacillus flavithermus]MCG6195960.1 permease [Anoxybacillus sp. LAT_38]MCG3083587.1 permease [Anoxybacillus sp. LAT27]MCG6170310.1 permease [Anoxybacillus sp. LAT_11]MCG6174841.1 permease [Anoxybacillus sp. LAT_31]